MRIGEMYGAGRCGVSIEIFPPKSADGDESLLRTLVRLEAHTGSRFPAYATSTGRVLLAGLHPERLDGYFSSAKLEALTERTVVDPARLRQLISVVSLSEFPYAVLLEQRERLPVVDQIPGFIRCRRRPARKNTPICDLERVQIGFGNNAPERVAATYEVDNHPVRLANRFY